MRPPCLFCTVTCFIVCVTYFPPRSVNADAYLDHFTTATDELLMKYPGAGVTILGGTNDLDIQPLLNGNRFIQVVDQPTIEEIFWTRYLPTILTCIPAYPSTPPSVGVITIASCGALSAYMKNQIIQLKRKKSALVKDSGLRAFGQWITHQSWDNVLESTDVSEKCNTLMTTVQSQVDLNLPTRQVKLHTADRPWMTAHVKSMINDRQRAFKKGDNLRWEYLRNKVSRCIAKAKKDYNNTRVSRLKTSNPSAWYRQIKIPRGILPHHQSPSQGVTATMLILKK